MRFRHLLPLFAIPTLIACGAAEDTEVTIPAESTSIAQSPESELESILHVVNELSYDQLLTEADLDPSLANAIVEARASGVVFTSKEQLDDFLMRNMPAGNPMCAYWQGMAQYYAIRALQCAYSVCYPMSPWYGYMAEYYNGFVDLYCD